jgi:hypothetical protein
MIKLWDPRLKGKGDYAADSSGPVACVYRIPTGARLVLLLQRSLLSHASFFIYLMIMLFFSYLWP